MRPEGTSVCGLTYKQRERELLRRQVCCHMLLCVRIRQHASAYVYIHTNRERVGSVDGSPQAGVAAAACRMLLCVRIRQHASAYVYIPTNRERKLLGRQPASWRRCCRVSFTLRYCCGMWCTVCVCVWVWVLECRQAGPQGGLAAVACVGTL
jgi:hypothetical protein